jgi:hypothetical protein
MKHNRSLWSWCKGQEGPPVVHSYIIYALEDTRKKLNSVYRDLISYQQNETKQGLVGSQITNNYGIPQSSNKMNTE